MAEKTPRKQWACPKERSKHYSLQFQKRMQTEDSPRAKAWREKRAETDRRNRAKRTERRRAEREPERIRAMAEKLDKANADKRAKAAAARPKRPFDQEIVKRAPSVIEVTPPKPVLMSSQEWERMGGKVQRLESNWQKPIGRISFPVSLY